MSEIITVSIRFINDFSCKQDSAISALPFGENEKTRLNSIENSTYKAQSLAALIALKDILPPDINADMTILRTVNRKPYFAELPLSFSLAHSKHLSVAALGDTSVGIDIEILDPNRHFLKLANRFFSDEEKKRLTLASSLESEFYSIWTKKEALSKISGEGLPDIHAQNSLSCFCRQYILKHDNNTYFMSVCSSEKDDVVIKNAYKELTVYEI